MIGLVHLVWAPLGPGRLRRFLHSMREHPAGAEHELVILLNGLRAPGAAAREQLLAELDATPHRLLELERPMLDLGAYLEGARRLELGSLCFLNSYAEPLADGWLAELAGALALPGVGLAGATGSWESQAQWRRGAPRHWPLQLTRLPSTRRDYPRFPDPHVRTSSFIVERERLLGLELGPVRNKRDAYLIESGHHSLTRRIQAQGLRTVVAARGGGVHDPAEWPASETFRAGRQRGLLIADNQTVDYDKAPPARRRRLARDSWGARARSD